MVFDTNLAFKWMGLFWKNYDGENFSKINNLKSKLVYLYSRFWLLFAIYDAIRFAILSLYPRYKHGLFLGFYLCDWCALIKGKSYSVMMICGPIFDLWLINEILLFRKMYQNKRYRFWMKFFQIPKTREINNFKIKYYPKAKLIEFWKLSSYVQNIFKLLLGYGSFTMSVAAIAYFYAFKDYNDQYNLHTPFVFYSILILNYLSLVAIGTINIVQNCGLISFLYLIARLLGDRFRLIASELNQIAYHEFNQTNLDKQIENFNLIINDLIKCDFFFSKFNSINYHYSTLVCSILVLTALYTDDIFMVIFSLCLFFMYFMTTLMLTIFFSGQLHKSIKLSHQPLIKIIQNKEIKLIKRIKILRIINFINSERSGFKCGDLFLMKNHLILKIFLDVIVNSILIYDMTFTYF